MAASCEYSTYSIAGTDASLPDSTAAKTVLMISYFFPPAGGVGIAATQRIVKFLVGMQGSEWRPLVLTLLGEDYESYFEREPAYLSKIPAGVPVIRTRRLRVFENLLLWRGRVRARVRRGAAPREAELEAAAVQPQALGRRRSLFQRFKDLLTSVLNIPDPQIVWLPYALAAGLRILRRRNIDCLYATGSPWSGLIVARLLQVFTGNPLVLDFRDPWVANPYRAHFHPFRRGLESMLESFVLRGADAVIANTPELMAEFMRRYPKVDRRRFHAVYNSVEPDDASLPPATPAGDRKCIRLVHAGFLYGLRDPKSFLTALSRVLEEEPEWRNKVVLDLAGTVHLNYSLNGLLDALNLKAVTRVYGQVPHALCRQLLSQASILLLLQPGTGTQIPSKLFEYLSLNKPVLAFTSPGGATYNFMVNEEVGWAADCDDLGEMEHALRRCIRAAELQVVQPNAGRRGIMEKYSVPAVTRRLLDIFTAVTVRS